MADPARTFIRPFVRHTGERVPEIALTAFGDGDQRQYDNRPIGRLSSNGELTAHLRNRAERRERRRESMSS